MNAIDVTLKSDSMLPDQREVLEYWVSLRRNRIVPARSDFHPGKLQKRLPFISLVDVSADAARFRFRVAGTGLRDTFGMELTGRHLEDVPLGEQRPLWQAMYRDVARCAEPASGFTTLAWLGRPNVVQAWLRLPMTGDGEGGVTSILGYDRFIVVERKTLRDIAREGLPPAAGLDPPEFASAE
jgi:hypothetical protein